VCEVFFETLMYKKQKAIIKRLSNIETKIDSLLAKLDSNHSETKDIIKYLEDNMTVEFDTLTSRVNDTITVEESAIVLINGLAARLEALANDPAAILALAEELRAKNEELSAAVVRNTPAEPPVIP
jgi:hypothetical protein